jgi:hypothetical protein
MVNTVLGLVAAGLFTYIVWEFSRPLNTAVRPRPRGVNPVSPSALPAPASRETGPGAWGSVASRNLFSPARSDSGTASAGGVTATTLGPKPNLYGVVLREGAPLAYLEDPVTRRVTAYRVGDSVAGGVVKSISADGVMLARPDGQMDVRLHDPAKPRPPIPAAPQAPTVPPAAQGQPPVDGQPIAPPAAQTGQPPGPPRRTLPPNILRRLPQGSPAETPPQGYAPSQ